MQSKVQIAAFLADTAREEAKRVELVNMAYSLLKQLNENDRDAIIAEVMRAAM